MIYSLLGKLTHKTNDLAVVECAGVGYACRVSLQTAAAAPGVGQEALLYTRLAVREDEIALYGFATKAERSVFDQLTGVSGVGPKMALAVLSDFTPDRFALAVASGDYKQFTKSKGIGAKTAQRIVLELKDKVAKSVAEQGLPVVTVQTDSGSVGEAMSALQVLGYSQGEAAGVLAALDPALPASELIRLSLKELGKHL
jgi:Holliday junction DNA helicase RuvA